MLKSKERGEEKPEANPNKVKTRQGKVNCNDPRENLGHFESV